MNNIISLLGFLATMLLVPQAMAATTSVNADAMATVAVTNPPRAYGVQIGDKLSRQFRLSLPENGKLTKDNLPVAGSRQSGVELVDVQLRQDGRQGQYLLQLGYQVFASHEQAIAMQLPELNLKWNAADGQEQVLHVPAWRFWFAPLISSNAARLGKAMVNMQSQFRPPLVETQGLQRWLWGFIGLSIAAVLALLYINADRKWLPFMGGAFAEAHRRIKRIKPGSPAATQEAFYHMHMAFNSWYGSNCFAQDIDSFVQKNPHFGKSRADIARFFVRSNEHLFFGQGRDAVETIKELKLLSKQFRHCERGVA